jgi:hypothetical protein
VDDSEDSSSAKWEYEFVRESRVEALRVTWGSEVKSQVPPSSSADEREANEAEVGVGGKIRNLTWFDRQRGVGMES